MIIRIWAVSQKILIFILVLASVLACETKKDKSKKLFLELINNVDFSEKGLVDIFDDNREEITLVNQDGTPESFDLEKIYRDGLVGIYVFNQTWEYASYGDREAFIMMGFTNNSLHYVLIDDGILFDERLDKDIEHIINNNLFDGEGAKGSLGYIEMSKYIPHYKYKDEDDNSNGWEYIKETLQYDGSLLSERYEKYFENKDGDFIVEIEIDGSKFSINQVDTLNGIDINLDEGRIFSLSTGEFSLGSQAANGLIKRVEAYIKIIKSKEGNTKQVKMMQEIINRAKKY